MPPIDAAPTVQAWDFLMAGPPAIDGRLGGGMRAAKRAAENAKDMTALAQRYVADVYQEHQWVIDVDDMRTCLGMCLDLHPIYGRDLGNEAVES